MATRLDQQIEQLENIVEKRLGLCKVTQKGLRCTLPANHDRTEPHKFPVDFSPDANLAANSGAFVGQERSQFAATDAIWK